MTSDTGITDAMIERAIEAYNTKRWHTNMSGDAQRADMDAALEAVVGDIRASALREAADEFTEAFTYGHIFSRPSVQNWLRARADVEVGR